MIIMEKLSSHIAFWLLGFESSQIFWIQELCKPTIILKWLRLPRDISLTGTEP